jgi:hypothetical protein
MAEGWRDGEQVRGYLRCGLDVMLARLLAAA